MSDEAEDVARDVKDSRVLKILARVGFAVSGLLHVIIGAIAISVVTGSHGSQPSQSGALSQLAAAPGGEFVLWIMVVGLAALGLWLILQAFLVPGRDPKRKWAHKIGAFAKGIVYLLIGFTALTFALGGRTNSAKSSRDASAALLAAPGGVVALVAVGVGVLVVGGYFVFKGAAAKFTDDIRLPAGAMGALTFTLGVVGYIAKGAVLAAVGVLFVIAAITYKPSEAAGLDGALKTLAALPLGFVILVAIGIGLIIYGLYCFARAALARL